MSVNSNREKLLSVQGLRAVAALLVLIFHIDAMFREGAPRSREFAHFWARGFAGVDMFFVISGFIMVYVTRDIAPSVRAAGRFFYDRVTRIYPLWWVFAGLMMLYFYLATGVPAAHDKVQGDAVLSHVLKSLFLLPQTHDPVLGVGWTLIHEMLFYSLFAIGMLFSRRLLPVWLTLWAVLILGYGAWAIQPLHAQNLTGLIFHPLNLEFILGAFMALFVMSGKGGAGLKWLCAGLILFVLALAFDVLTRLRMLGLNVGHDEFNWVRVVFYGLPSAMIILGAVKLEKFKRLKTPLPLFAIGNWSYSLYLSHLLVLRALQRIWERGDDYLPETLRWGADGIWDNLAYISVSILASLIVAWISYHAIERTSLRWLRAKKVSV